MKKVAEKTPQRRKILKDFSAQYYIIFWWGYYATEIKISELEFDFEITLTEDMGVRGVGEVNDS